jgi:outer membrane murein-binding lipoprotein Lpp
MQAVLLKAGGAGEVGESMPGRAHTRETSRGFGKATAVAAALAALMLAGCSGSMVADHMPAAVGGLPAGAPERPAVEQAYPAVHSTPPQRTTTTLSEAQQKALESDLVAVRNRTNTDAPTTTGSTGNSSTGAAARP